MQRPEVAGIQDSAYPVFKVEYWTADAEGSTAIKKWLEGEKDPLTFYGSFVNWCCQQVEKLASPGTKWGVGAKEKSLEVKAVLREQPLNVVRFIGLMEDYRDNGYGDGVKGGVIVRPEAENTLALQNGQKYLRSLCCTKDERDEMLVAAGREHELSNKSRKKLERERNAAKEKEEEERKSAFGQWSETRAAVGEVEGEIEMEDATTALGGVEISQRQPWEQQLADRSK